MLARFIPAAVVILQRAAWPPSMLTRTPQAVQAVHTRHGGATTEVALLMFLKENQSRKLPEDGLLPP